MKVEMVMTPEACRRQTSKNSRDSSAFIAHLPTPLFLLHLFFLPFIRTCVCMCVCFFTSRRAAFPFCYRRGWWGSFFMLAEVLLCSGALELRLYLLYCRPEVSD